MDPHRDVTISRDSYLEPLGLGELARSVRGAETNALCYALIVKLLHREGLVLDVPFAHDGINELPFKVPGLPVTVRLKGSEIGDIGFALAILFSSGRPDPTHAGLAALVAFVTRVRKLRTEFGEQSILEVLNQGAPTAEGVTLGLFGKPCRHPKSGCRFHTAETGTCAITLDAVTATLEALEKAKVVEHRNAAPPIEYKVVL